MWRVLLHVAPVLMLSLRPGSPVRTFYAQKKAPGRESRPGAWRLLKEKNRSGGNEHFFEHIVVHKGVEVPELFRANAAMV